ncbi:MAG: restriction endonuclease subunit S [Syntrophomonadaceae bacterium]|jgi:type I restriction enzyme S subunit
MYEIKYRSPNEMKDSGVEWLGMVPKEWVNKKINWLFRNIGSGATPNTSIHKYYDNGDINWLLTGDLNDSYVYETSKKVTELALKQNSALKIYPIETLVIAMYGATIGKLGITRILTTTNQACCCFTNPINTISKYIYYWFLGNRSHIINMGYGGGQPNISKDLLLNLRIPIGPKNEQQQIVDFLDIKTAQFDSIISKKELLIKKLEEAKKSLISEVVTGKVKIIDGNMVPRQPEEMKDSGVEWLGMIPRDWHIKKLKYLMRINPTKSEVTNKNLLCSFVPMNKIHNDLIETDEVKRVKEVYNGYTYFKDGDLIMAKVTPCFENGDIAIAENLVNGLGFGTTEINVFRVNDEYDKYFVYYALQESHFMRYGISHMTGVAGLKRIPTNYISNYKIPIPDQNEQKTVSNYIRGRIQIINSIINKTQLQIQILKQAKQSLISEAVTGKIDLRDWEIIEEGGI